MQIYVPVLLLAIAVTAYGRVAQPVTATEEDAVESYRWRKPVGWTLEKIGKWLQGRRYTAEDGEELDAEDFSPRDLREVGAELEKISDALEEGETLNAAVIGDEASEYGIGKWGKRIRDFAKKFPAIVTG